MYRARKQVSDDLLLGTLEFIKPEMFLKALERSIPFDGFSLADFVVVRFSAVVPMRQMFLLISPNLPAPKLHPVSFKRYSFFASPWPFAFAFFAQAALACLSGNN